MFRRGLLAFAVMVLVLPSKGSAQSNVLSPTNERLRQLLQENILTDPVERLQSPLEEPGVQRQPARGQAIPALSERELKQLLGVKEEPSALEKDFSERSGEELRQFGYENFRKAAPRDEQRLSGAVSENYRVGIGDEIVATFRGQVSRSFRVRVDREGRIVLPSLAPVPAAGRRFGELRQDIEGLTDQTFINTQVFVSLGAVRMVSVLVTGEVAKPGSHVLSGFSTVLDALVDAGGIKKTGSLRRVRVTRGGRSFAVDLYDVILAGQTARDLTLADGDTISVPTLRPTVAVTGAVLRPGIYEITRTTDIPAAEVLALAGGPLRPRGNRYLRISADETGRDHVIETASLEGVLVADRDILGVFRATDVRVGSVFLDGHVAVPGRRSLGVAPTVAALVGSYEALAPNPYLPFAVLITTDDRTRARYLVGVNLEDALTGRRDLGLRPDDRLVVLDKRDIRFIASADVQAALQNKLPPILNPRVFEVRGASADRQPRQAPPIFDEPSPAQVDTRYAELVLGGRKLRRERALEADPERPEIRRPDETDSRQRTREEKAERIDTPKIFCGGLQLLAAIVVKEGADRFDNALQIGPEKATIPNILGCPEVYDRFPDLLPFVVEHAVAVDGAVRQPGLYPVTRGTPMMAVLNVAGGFTRFADLSSLELSRNEVDAQAGTSQMRRELLRADAPTLERIALRPGDVVRVNRVESNWHLRPVQITGEVRQPGQYKIRRGERLSEVIARAGGLTERAYPYGAVFARESIREREQENFHRAARAIQLRMTEVLAAAKTPEEAAGAAQVIQTVVTALKTAVPLGRIVVEADPAVLQVRPELDAVLEPGDELFVPARVNIVTVSGDVLNPGNLPFTAGSDVDGYVRMAGGLQASADDDRLFVLLPNGIAQPVSISFWNYKPLQIPPGSTVIVPKDLTPFNLTAFAKDLTQILGQLTISAASLSVINRD